MDKARLEAIRIFADDVSKTIKDYLPAEYREYQCQVMENQKNNGIRKIGISFKKPEHQVSPLIYMDGYYDAVQNGMNLTNVMNQIADVVKENSPIQNTFQQRIVPSIMDYNCVKPHIVVQLVNAKANREMLKNIPHRRIEDLAMICVAEFNSPEHGVTASAKVNDALIKHWGIERSELFETALENTRCKYPPRLSGIEDTMGEMLGFYDYEDHILSRTDPISPARASFMYVLTNTAKENGASVILYPGLMDQISKLFPNGFYLLPSSRHEVLLIPDNGEYPPKVLGEMVREVNKTLDNPENYLSDRVYRYDKDRGQICQIPESMEQKKEMAR